MRPGFLLLLIALTAPLGAVSFDEGKEAFGRQDWKAAVSLLTRFGADHPDDPQAVSAAFLRGVALFQLGEARSSLDAFQKLDRTWPRSAYAGRLPYWKGTAALAAGLNETAERELAAQAQFPAEEPFTTRALLNLALARLALGKTEEAVPALQAFTSASTEPALLSQAWAVWADVDRKAGRAEAALDRYRRAWEAGPLGRWDLSSRTLAADLLLAEGRWTEARRLADDSAAVFPGEADRWDDRRISAARGLGDLSGLSAALERRWAREKAPAKKQQLAANRARTAEDAGAPDPLWWGRAAAGPDEALALSSVLRQAFLVEQGGDPKAAAGILEAWAGRTGVTRPAVETARDRAAADRAAGGDAAGARRLWDGLLTAYPKSDRVPGWLLARGRSSLDAGDPDRALADFSRLLRDWPQAGEAPEARYQTGVVYLRRQEPARAEGWFYGLVQELKSGDLYQRSLLARGVSFVNAGQMELARGSLSRLLRESPSGPWTGAAWTALGRNAALARLFDEAADAYARAEETERDPAARASASWSRAETLASAGRAQDAAAAFGRYRTSYAGQSRADEAAYRQGAVLLGAGDPEAALAVWTAAVADLPAPALALVREGMALAHLRAHRPAEGWSQLELLEATAPGADALYRWGLAANTAGEASWADQAFEKLLRKYPESKAAEAALPRAAGALLGVGRPEEALARYAAYFGRSGRQSAAAPVARAAATAALGYPDSLRALVAASADWNLAPEVRTEFQLVWAQSRLDAESAAAAAELQTLAQTAPWTSQRSEALAILGRWQLGRGNLVDARRSLEAAAALGDDLSVFKARWALSQLTEREGDLITAARQKETVERTAGPGVPLEFRLQVLSDAAQTWDRAGRGEEARRVQARIAALRP